MRTLRLRLLLGTAIGTTVLLLIAGVLLYALIRDALWHEFDESLATKARSLAAMIEQEDDELELGFDEANLPEFGPSQHAEFYQVWRNGADVLARSASLAGRDLDFVDGSLDRPGYQSGVLPDGRAGRAVGISLAPRQDNENRHPGQPLTVTLVIGRETGSIQSTLARLKLILAAVGLAAVLVSLVVLAWSVRRGLRPVDRLAAQIGDVGESDLSARINAAGVPSELLPVVDRLNDLLARLESAFQRERRFTADVAHELRTPLAGVRSMLEVALSRQRESESYRQVMSECLTVNQQMHQMVENLLSLARADADQLAVEREPVDLPDLLRECWKSLAEPAKGRRLTVDWSLEEPCTLDTDRGKFQLILQNILDNAVTYADSGGRIGVKLASDNGQIELTVTNTGSTISRQDAGRVFDRFWQGDASRQASGRHCGLGLALCKMLVTLLGGSISARSAESGEFSVVMRYGVRVARSRGG